MKLAILSILAGLLMIGFGLVYFTAAPGCGNTGCWSVNDVSVGLGAGLVVAGLIRTGWLVVRHVRAA